MSRRAPLRRTKTTNRFAAVLCHISRYNGRYLSQLSADTGIKPDTLRRIIQGTAEPHPLQVLSLWQAICTAAKKDLPIAELIVPEGQDFPTRHPCELFNCRCYPPWAHDENNTLKPEFTGISPGTWTFEVSPSTNTNR